MLAPPTKRVWPILVADLEDPAARDFLTGIALAGSKAFLPLMAAPANASTHLLEIHTPGSVDPLILFAEPLGPPTAVGFPLRLRPFDPNEAPPAPKPPSARKDVRASKPMPDAPELGEPAPRMRSQRESELRPRQVTNHKLSVRHEEELAGKESVRKPEALLGRELAGGKLRIDALIGEGGVGAVYRAFHRDLRIPVAVKVLHEDYQEDLEFCRKFHAEALAASRLDHVNLMRVLDFGQEPDGLLYLAMEFLDGESLADVMKPNEPMPLQRIVDVMVQVCAGLAHAHVRGTLHRDVKPDNVILIANRDDDDRPDELVKVCDFGIAMQDSEGPAKSKAIVGTPDYMSPEQCRGDALDGRSDVYSCGVMLFEMATGKLPFTAKNPVGLLNRHMNMPPPAPSEINANIDPRLEAIILKALEKEPADRHQSMRELRGDLRMLIEGTPASSRRNFPESIQSMPAVSAAAIAAAVAAQEVTGPDWLERGSGSFRKVEPATGPKLPNPSGGSMGTLPSVSSLAVELAAKPAPWLAKLAQTSKQDSFEQMARELDGAIPFLIADRNLRALFAIRSTLDVLGHDDGARPQWQVARARQSAITLGDPAFLGALAEQALASDDPPREIFELLVRAGAPAAYAVYSARLKMAAVDGARDRFVKAVRRFGVDAMPMIRAGLTKLEGRRDYAVASALAVDLFMAVPRVRDDAAGEIAARYIDGSRADLAAAATAALVTFWGERARPIVLGLLSSPDEEVLIAAVNGLKDLRAIDERVVPKLASIASKATSEEVRTAVRDALGTASEESLELARKTMQARG